jgi:hypothetical protein
VYWSFRVLCDEICEEGEWRQKKMLTNDEPAKYSGSPVIAWFGICNGSKEIRSLTPIGCGVERLMSGLRIAMWVGY